MSIEAVPIVSESSATTLAAYENHAQVYIDGTTKEVSADSVKSWIGASLEGLSSGAQILEIGSATSRDADYMESKNFKVKRTDAADSFVKFLHENGHQAKKLNVLTDQIEGGNDLIFANSVLQHFTPDEVKTVLTKFHEALNDNGRLSFSITKGEGESWSERIGAPRFFHFWQPAEITALLQQTGFVSVDVKSGDDPVWLNIIARKGAEVMRQSA